MPLLAAYEWIRYDELRIKDHTHTHRHNDDDVKIKIKKYRSTLFSCCLTYIVTFIYLISEKHTQYK